MDWTAIIPHSLCHHENDDHSYVSQSLNAWLLKNLFTSTHLGTCEFVALESRCESLSLPTVSFWTFWHCCCNIASYLLQICLCVCMCVAQVTWEVWSCNSVQSLMLGQYAGWRHPARIMYWLETSSWLHWKGRLCVLRKQVCPLCHLSTVVVRKAAAVTFSSCMLMNYRLLLSLFSLEF